MFSLYFFAIAHLEEGHVKITLEPNPLKYEQDLRVSLYECLKALDNVNITKAIYWMESANSIMRSTVRIYVDDDYINKFLNTIQSKIAVILFKSSNMLFENTVKATDFITNSFNSYGINVNRLGNNEDLDYMENELVKKTENIEELVRKDAPKLMELIDYFSELKLNIETYL